MSNINHPIFYALVMLVAGLGIPVMATLNAGLGARLENPMLASTVLFVVAIVAAVASLLVFQGVPKAPFSNSVPIHFYLGGFFVVFYVLSITWIAPKFGVGNAVAFVLLGQIISMAIIDHYRLMGAMHHPISIQRFSGLVLMAVGVFLAVRRV
ncbi:MAG: DMT family transporter [Porticoccaceae bacterium]